MQLQKKVEKKSINNKTNRSLTLLVFVGGISFTLFHFFIKGAMGDLSLFVMTRTFLLALPLVFFHSVLAFLLVLNILRADKKNASSTLENSSEKNELLNGLTRLSRLSYFKVKVHQKLATKGQQRGAMITIGLDNLKFLNSVYGHESGDRYIIAAASLLKECEKEGALCAHISGDEFALYLHDCASTAQCRKKVLEYVDRMKNKKVDLGHGNIIKIRFTVGVSYYPTDSASVDDLLRYSAYAMAEAKGKRRGSVVHFSKESYLKKAYRMNMREGINRLIEENLVRYAFQPIIRVKDYSIYGYEVLMRPLLEGLHTPLEVLELASLQSKLYDIERMTLFNVMAIVDKNREFIEDKKIFFNTLASQSLTEEDEAFLMERYADLFHSVVFEVTEDEIEDEEVFKQKITSIRAVYKGGIAIDDYGSGYSNELRVLSIDPDVIKFDRGLISDIDTDLDRQVIVSNLISYCKERKILTLAEGVETAEEFQQIVAMGVDLAQGYYIAYPEFGMVSSVTAQ